MKQILAFLARLPRANIVDETEFEEQPKSCPVNSIPPATILDQTGSIWCCSRQRKESDRNFAFRLEVHLTTLQIAIEEDLERVLQAERALKQRSEWHGESDIT